MIFARIRTSGTPFYRDETGAAWLVSRLALSSVVTGCKVCAYDIEPGRAEFILSGDAGSFVSDWLSAAGRKAREAAASCRPFSRLDKELLTLCGEALADRAFLYLSAAAVPGRINSLAHMRLPKENFSLSNFPGLRERRRLFSTHMSGLGKWPVDRLGMIWPRSFVDYGGHKHVNRKYGKEAVAAYDRRDFLLRTEKKCRTGIDALRRFIVRHVEVNGSSVMYQAGLVLPGAIMATRERFSADPLSLSLASGLDYEDVVDIILSH